MSASLSNPPACMSTAAAYVESFKHASNVTMQQSQSNSH